MRFALLLTALSFSLAACTGAGPGVAEVISPDNYVAQFVEADAEHILVDVRTPGEFAGGYIEGAVNIPVQDLQARLGELPQGVPVVVYCRSGNRSAQASQILRDGGHNEIYDLGGVIQWSAAGYPLQ